MGEEAEEEEVEEGRRPEGEREEANGSKTCVNFSLIDEDVTVAMTVRDFVVSL